MTLATTTEYQNLLSQIAETYSQSWIRAMQLVNSQMTTTYWQVGRHIVEFEQGGKVKAEYGKALISNLARDLSLQLGKNFNRSNLVYMRLFYIRYPISKTVSHQLTWSHIIELLKIDDSLERGFYEQQTIQERWSIRELKRQKDSALFLRLAISKDKAKILELSTQGQILEQAKIFYANPISLNFLKSMSHTKSQKPNSRRYSAIIYKNFYSS
jgi:hypothetical protein